MQKEIKEKKEFIKKYFSHIEHFGNKICGRNYKDIIEVDNIIYKGYHYSGLYDTGLNEPVEKAVPIFYFCKRCNEKKWIKKGFHSAFSKKANIDFVCQKCKTKENSQKEEFKEKERVATKKAWENGRYDNLKKNGYFLEWGRKWCNNTIYKTEEEKKEIAAKKIKTYLSHTYKERKELDHKRSKHFKEKREKLNAINDISKIEYFDKRFSNNEWRELRLKIIRKNNFTCRKCGKIYPKSELSVHHLIPYRVCKEDKEENLIPLCKQCHSEVERFIDRMILENRFSVENELYFLKSEKIDKKELNSKLNQNKEIIDGKFIKTENNNKVGEIINETSNSYYILWK